MAVIGVPVINAAGIPEDVSRTLPSRDPILSGVANEGVRFMADLAFPWCYPGGAPSGRPAAGNPLNGATITDMAEQLDGSLLMPAGSITYQGGGFSFTNCEALTGSRNAGLSLPASVLADLWTAYGGNSQHYLFTAWVRLPTLANWNASGALLSIAGDLSYLTGASLFILAQKSGGTLEVRRQTSAGNYDVTNVLTLTPDTGDYGGVVQITVWRNAAGQGLRLKSENGTILVTRAVGSANTENFSANTFTVGRNGAAFPGASATTTLPSLSGFRVFRVIMENLARSGRDPITVADADYTAVTARAVFS
jgi:hypothetical protein